MFRTRVICLWLQMVGLAALLALAAPCSISLFTNDDALLLVLLLPVPLAMVALLVAIVFSWLMMTLMQRLLIAAGTRAGRPAHFQVFRHWLNRYSLLPAALPLLTLLVPRVRSYGWVAVGVLGLWAVAALLVWRFNARRLHREWETGQSY